MHKNDIFSSYEKICIEIIYTCKLVSIAIISCPVHVVDKFGSSCDRGMPNR